MNLFLFFELSSLLPSLSMAMQNFEKKQKINKNKNKKKQINKRKKTLVGIVLQARIRYIPGFGLSQFWTIILALK